MTKKDFTKIAAVLKDCKPEVDEKGYNTEGLLMGNIEINVWNNTVESIAFMLQSDNPRFDKARFYSACGYSE